MLSIRQDARLLVGEGAAGLGEWAAEASERKVPARDMNVPEPPARSDGEDDVARLGCPGCPRWTWSSTCARAAR